MGISIGALAISMLSSSFPFLILPIVFPVYVLSELFMLSPLLDPLSSLGLAIVACYLIGALIGIVHERLGGKLSYGVVLWLIAYFTLVAIYLLDYNMTH
jgi:hypothetical protein